ncbi:hypothetical protein GCM10010435_11460 [Winogradskya consettensis]|uniref:YcxB-like C-terminal domain-containing protein n=1 Tax=Winogradskya consettensis TaxID=113560 RepID=A0A919SZ03_9ACTN|nr:YcxB family protein [Actinoplanes consettensis]GIM80299.1 hypothetical protein Aco04nite_70000 [Actinoplanes consettensis]
MSLTFQAQPDRRLLAAAVRHVSRSRIMLVRWVGGVVTAVGVVTFPLLSGDVFLSVVDVVLGLFLAVGCPVIAVRRAVGVSERLVARPLTYTFTETGFTTMSDLATTNWSWAAVTGIDELRDQILIRVNKSQFVPIPTAGLSPEQLSDLRTILHNRGATPAAELPAASSSGIRPATP